MTPEQIEMPTVSNVDQDLQREPEIREGYVLDGRPVKWVPYKPQGAKQMKRKGRWKAMNEYGGWDNCETPAQIWSGFISYSEMAEHIIAQREQIEAMEKRVKAARGALADIFDGEPQWPHKPKKELKWCRKRAEEAYRATGGQDNGT